MFQSSRHEHTVQSRSVEKEQKQKEIGQVIFLGGFVMFMIISADNALRKRAGTGLALLVSKFPRKGTEVQAEHLPRCNAHPQQCNPLIECKDL